LKDTISVIIPAYNSEKYIKRCIQSVLAQTKPVDEIIIVNDGSSDRTEQLVLSIVDNRIQLITTQNSGPAHARNKGVQIAKGKWIALLDADDYWDQKKIESFFYVISQDPNLDFISTNIIRGNDSIGWTYLDLSRKQQENKPIFSQLYRKSFIATSSVIVKREKIIQTNFFNQHYKYAEDFDLWLRILYKGANYKLVPKYHTFYYLREDSLSANLMRSYLPIKNILMKHAYGVDWSLFFFRIFIHNIQVLRSELTQRHYMNACKIAVNTIFDCLTSFLDYNRHKNV